MLKGLQVSGLTEQGSVRMVESHVQAGLVRVTED